MVSLPDELFYPNASAITTIIIAKAHEPQPKDSSVFMGRISNDGFEKLKGKRVECPGNQIPMIASSFLPVYVGGGSRRPVLYAGEGGENIGGQ